MLSRTRTRLHARVRLGVGIIGWIVLGAGLVFGQGATATISGVVRDATGGIIPAVSVTAKHTESGLTRTVQTDGGRRLPHVVASGRPI